MVQAETLSAPWLSDRHSTCESGERSGIGIADSLEYEELLMTRTQRILVGAIVLGVAIGVYVLFFCPTDCH